MSGPLGDCLQSFVGDHYWVFDGGRTYCMHCDIPLTGKHVSEIANLAEKLKIDIETLKEGIKSFREWIRIDVALPEEPSLCLVFHYYTPSLHIVFWDGKSWDKKLDITHWMPLPEHPTDWVSVALGDGRLVEAP